ncbi:hypothetical protein V5799_021181 [Amblyomma americanum]|uniref:Uncharacterized protein n=1 Tax=Amblyomma americanum TaxID=6943 RepID=A0AAQ4FSS4_AMBAM
MGMHALAALPRKVVVRCSGAAPWANNAARREFKGQNGIEHVTTTNSSNDQSLLPEKGAYPLIRRLILLIRAASLGLCLTAVRRLAELSTALSTTVTWGASMLERSTSATARNAATMKSEIRPVPKADKTASASCPIL